MKTKVEVVERIRSSSIEKGSEGYIDGYVIRGEDRPFAIVVVGGTLDLLPLFALKVIQEPTKP